MTRNGYKLAHLVEDLNVGGFRKMPREGDRVFQFAIIDRYPDFQLPPGGRGTITTVDRHRNGDIDFIAVRMDEHIPGAEEWDNEIHFYGGDNETVPEFFFSFTETRK